eukprot:Amastigsp_a1235_25.p2 type:complete len:160 gc:universal Amastigsp_a1235_25:912-1391(+)
MDDALAVQVRHRRDQLEEHKRGVALREGLRACNALKKIRAGDILHDEVDLLWRLVDVLERDDVWVLDRGHDLHLVEHQIDSPRKPLLLNDLDSILLARLLVGCEFDDGERAAPEDLGEAVVLADLGGLSARNDQRVVAVLSHGPHSRQRSIRGALKGGK